MFESLALGKIVHYVMRQEDFGPDSASAARSKAAGQPNEIRIVRPAIVVETWGNEKSADQKKAAVNLLVFVDGANDMGHPKEGQAAATTIWRTSVARDEDEFLPGTWHWPTR